MSSNIISAIKNMVRFTGEKKTPLGRWCHQQYIETCCSKVQDRKAELANIDNSLDIRKVEKNNYNSGEDYLISYYVNNKS